MPLFGGTTGVGDALRANTLAQFAATTSAELAGVISNETGTGSLVFGTSPIIVTPTITGAITLPNDTRQVFKPGGTNAGINVGAFAGNPSTPVNGDLWYDSTANKLTTRINGLNVLLGTAGGGGDALVANPLSQFAATTSAQLAGVINDETGTGLLVFATSPTITTPTISGAVSFQSDVRQTFNPGATTSGLNVGSLAGDPSAPSNGDLWYDSTANELTGRINGANVALGAAGGGGANTALSNLASVAINTSLLPGTDDGAALGSTTNNFSDLFLATGAVINYQNGNVVLTHTTGLLTLVTGNFEIITAGASAGSVVTNAGTQTLTAKRITKRIGTEASSATSAPAADTADEWHVTALAVDDVFDAPTGTPTDGQTLVIRILDNGTSRLLSFNAIYRDGTDVTLPTSTVANKILYLGFKYNVASAKWDLLAKTGGL